MSERIEDNDRELVIKVQNGDLNAFSILVDKYKNKSLSLAVSIVKDTFLGEDIIQEVFIKVHSKIKNFRFKSKFSTWLYRIVVNTSYNELKKRKHTIPISIYEISEDVRPGSTNGKSLSIEEQKKYIKYGMMLLKEDEALILRLFYLCENSIKEIEDITNFNSSKIRVNLHRGRKNLKRKLISILGAEIDSLL
ncbi:RNA polymerase sigma factor [Christiangramia salexigens]|uniref:Uncharacterized protein n=1 Tax=Christiangramia salexigens TaxID=1913577 RepID=A0A1L3J412_9FLAO|nr:sigma-70 family RNA polymerase sigma factor [Christiangramia salexigens]APG59840.1 hypothetical protein LPB144_05160 [Christiangramia salexigens]